MSIETQRRLLLSEWRTVLVSQMSYPLMFKYERPDLSQEELRSFPEKYVTVKIPLGNRIITKWQEQVRPMGDDDHSQWHVVREWTEAEIGRDYSKLVDGHDREAGNNRVTDQTQINQILSQFGLDSNNYLLSPPPGFQSSRERESQYNRTSAFSNYPLQETKDQRFLLQAQSQSLLSPGRTIPYVQQPPPPPPLAQPPANQPPPPFQRDSAPFAQQGPPPPPPQSQQQPPPLPPTSAPSTTSNPLASFTSLFNKGTSNPQNTGSQSPTNMNPSILSPRRTPPLPPLSVISHRNESNLSAEHYLREVNCAENPPVKVVKPSTQNVVYRKEIRIRYLQPPTPPPPAPIIIREKHIPAPPPQSPLLIRERKPEARTPPPLTIRERPPTPPAPLEPYVIDKTLPPPPPQPRQIIIERLPTPPPKPRTVIFEKWLPYKKVKRPVLLQKAPPPEPVKPTRNVVIEYEPLKAFTVRRVIEEGVFRVDPHQYTSHSTKAECGGDVRVVERIEDLPPPSDRLMRVLNEYNHTSVSPSQSYDRHCNQSYSEHIPSSVQHLLTGGQSISNTDHLANVSRASNTPGYRQERVLSTGYDSAIQSPTVVPIHRSSSKGTPYSSKQHYTTNDSPIRSHIDDIY